MWLRHMFALLLHVHRLLLYSRAFPFGGPCMAARLVFMVVALVMVLLVVTGSFFVIATSQAHNRRTLFFIFGGEITSRFDLLYWERIRAHGCRVKQGSIAVNF